MIQRPAKALRPPCIRVVSVAGRRAWTKRRVGEDHPDQLAAPALFGDPTSSKRISIQAHHIVPGFNVKPYGICQMSALTVAPSPSSRRSEGLS
jgi:hypothetical protein